MNRMAERTLIAAMFTAGCAVQVCLMRGRMLLAFGSAFVAILAFELIDRYFARP